MIFFTQIEATHLTELKATRLNLYNNKCNKITPPKQTRKIRPTRRSVSGILSYRGEVSIPFESTLERDFILRKEFNRFVLEVIPQPVQIPFEAADGRSYIYTPDFLVYYRSDDYPWGCGLKPLLVEVKPREEIRENWVKMKPKFRAALRYAKEQGWDFRIHDESRIRDQVLDNIRFLGRYKRMQYAQEDTQHVISNLKVMGQAPFHYLVSRHFYGSAETATGIAHIWHLLATGQVECDMTQPFTNNTVLWVPSQEIPTHV